MAVVEVARPVRQVGDTSVDAGRGPGQLPWYEYAARTICRDKVVLDVGCGLGNGLDILAKTAREVRGQDLDGRLVRPNVHIGPLEGIPDKSVDVITCVDVIEHVEQDEAFVRQLARVARERIFVSTPNWTLSRCEWPYHVREYTPRQLRDLLKIAGQVTMSKGAPSGAEVWPVNDFTYDMMNAARNWPPTGFATRCFSRILPRSARLHAHLAALVDVRVSAAG
ncbi:bifunctional 2-polyprenyl-6-hydroxyphenol methylase/3-demethylubiquinol 3-O-methyltransferase UbiG [Siccirubricoccus sp. G192]|uniref:class I SAM-dependent methyltransferase n=1 Tax=Siccirubricoccus sp. G192 TaxID=2849651 RepID=UPI001C2C6AA2|nr:methyltransferase domain-containing protein [Siccirubricoccus sp. G192]MBV1799997.1 methyltransferase domain-containing protein [Siccirubricoccus sp. G192]